MKDFQNAISTSPATSGDDGATLTINLTHLKNTYQFFQHQAPSAIVAAVVKADAYGLGIDKVVPSLVDAGCQQFFVAQVSEALACRQHAPDAIIYCFNGYCARDAEIYIDHHIRPCLTSLDHIRQWQNLAQKHGALLPAALYLDTGFHRLGLGDSELTDLLETPSLFEGWELALIMSHLACADRPEHPMNAAQLERFRDACQALPQAPRSLANSAGILLGDAFHGDIVRCGIGLYGGAPREGGSAQKPVVTIEAHILQIRDISAGDTVGYGADYVATREQKIAIVAAGYADGYLRQAGQGTPPFAYAHILGHPVPVIGRISMDLLAVDITDLPAELGDKIKPNSADGPKVELVGANSRIDDVAKASGTIAYELLTHIGNRYKRHYI